MVGGTLHCVGKIRQILRFAVQFVSIPTLQLSLYLSSVLFRVPYVCCTRISRSGLSLSPLLRLFECEHELVYIQDPQRLPTPIHSFCTTLLHPAAKHRHTGCIYGTVDAPTPSLRPPPPLIHLTARGRRSIGWRMGRSVEKSENQQENEAQSSRSRS